MTTITDLNYILSILNLSEYENDKHRVNFECCNTDEERADMVKALTDRSGMLSGVKAAEGVNKGTAPSVKTTKAAAELAKNAGVQIESIPPNAEGKVGVEEVNKALADK